MLILAALARWRSRGGNLGFRVRYVTAPSAFGAPFKQPEYPPNNRRNSIGDENMLVWLASYPRSGNGFAREVLEGVYGVRSYTIYDDGTPSSLAARRQTVAEVAAEDEHCFVKTHDRPGDDDYPTLYLVRDGRDSLVSYAWFHLTVDRQLDRAAISPKLFRQTLRNLITEKRSPFATWSTHVDAWLGRPRTAMVRFEQLIEAPQATLTEAVAQLKLPLEPIAEARVPTFAELHRQEPHKYRRGHVGSWRDEFPVELLDLFWQEHGNMMQLLGYGEDATNLAIDAPWRAAAG
ncbi:MAG: hypothetical protein DWQ42_09635 [Planctomycetota bacterium]|nr:MAG: hypothetical protein DWQ42_09635 [Planctomycetota bacterium]REK45890.1 MAG: hypothetical protein DWQ46_08350 [Planctomycetota bacterium]